MSSKLHWRQAHTYVRAARALGGRAAASLARTRQRPKPVLPAQLLGARPPGTLTGPTLFRSSFVTRRVLSVFLLLVLLAVALAAARLVWHEMRSSQWQARFFSEAATGMRFAMASGPSPAGTVRYPQDGPYDERLGYTRLPEFLERLQAKDFTVVAQARMSPEMAQGVAWGLFPPYREKAQLGLSIADCRAQSLFAARYPERIYAGFGDAPALLVKSLLFIENRELLDERYPLRNPAVDWGRLGKAALEHAVQGFGSDARSAGGSTLATQIEKYRHSPDGRTAGLLDKLRQMGSASVRAYLSGQGTSAVRRQLVVDYLNTVPLAARPGFGEIHGMGDGMWAWYGRDFAQVNALLHEAGNSGQPSRDAALAFKQALSLVIAQRRPSHYLGEGDSDLEPLTDSHLRLLAGQGVISHALRDSALAVKLLDQGRPRIAALAPSFVTRKAATAMRSQLVSLLGSASFYSLDRLDLWALSTLDGQTQEAVTGVLRQLRDADAAKAAGLQGKGLLGRGDPAQVVYSFTLLERGERANYLRLQTDNFDQPLDINEGAKLDLGSTAKLRTLVTYLDIVAQLHQRYGAADVAQLQNTIVDPKDRLSRWALDYLAHSPKRGLPAMLQAAMERSYSASPAEAFYTGGGLHTFSNFRREDDQRTLTVREGLRHSVNLVFVRLLRDVVHHYMFQVSGSSASLLQDAADPRRAVYLSRFAEREGREFIIRFLNKYQGKTAAQALELLLHNTRPTPARLAAILRSIDPLAGPERLADFLHENLPSGQEVGANKLSSLYAQFAPAKMGLADRGYVANVHPLELWVVGYLRAHPQTTPTQVLAASSAERQEVYQWLYASKRKSAQDRRILSLLEVEGFLEIHRQWKRLGYPFASLVPSYATALGASAERPAALAELMGILVNGGVRKPVQRIAALYFAADTPYASLLEHQAPKSEQVLAPEVAQVALAAATDVVQEGTARRVKKAFVRPDGSVMAVAGKTGTGDHRFEVYGVAGQVLESRVVSRSATFAFSIDERFFGSMTAYVYGPQAANYDFTSALPVQLLKVLAPSLMPLVAPPPDQGALPHGCRSSAQPPA